MFSRVTWISRWLAVNLLGSRQNGQEGEFNLGVAYSINGDKGSALEEYKILKTVNAEVANKLFNLIYE